MPPFCPRRIPPTSLSTSSILFHIIIDNHIGNAVHCYTFLANKSIHSSLYRAMTLRTLSSMNHPSVDRNIWDTSSTLVPPFADRLRHLYRAATISHSFPHPFCNDNCLASCLHNRLRRLRLMPPKLLLRANAVSWTVEPREIQSSKYVPVAFALLLHWGWFLSS